MSQPYIHPTAIVDDGVVLGENTKVWHFVHVSSGAKIGAGCALGQNVFVARNVQIGNGVRIQNNVSIYEGVDIEDDAFLGPSCVFTNVVNPRSFIQRKNEYRGTRVGRGASIGANATVVCGHDIGEYAFIGAGAVVTKNVPPYALIVGNPGRRSGWMCKCAARLPSGTGAIACNECGEKYNVTSERCEPI